MKKDNSEKIKSRRVPVLNDKEEKNKFERINSRRTPLYPENSKTNIEDINIDFLNQTQKQIKVSLELRNVVQDFFQRESSGVAMITVTRTKISKDSKNATIFITVLPESKEIQAWSFAKRQLSDLRDYLKEKMRLRIIPHLEIEIDAVEKKRFAKR